MTIQNNLTPNGSGAVTVSGKLSRRMAHNMLIQFPPEVKRRLDQAMVAGAQSAAVVALVTLALDELERNGQDLHAIVS